jgi:hypothetical protein
VLEDLFFGDDVVTVFEEVEEHVKHFGFNGNQLSGATQLAALRIDLITTETVDHRLHP